MPWDDKKLELLPLKPNVPEDDERAGLETKPFLAHLEDLRWTIIRCIVVLVLAMTVCAFAANEILQGLYQPLREAGRDPKDFLFTLNPTDPFSLHMEISFFGGLILSLPFLIYYIGQFLLPALTPREKRFLLPVFLAGSVLFFTGVAFCYFLVLKTSLEFFLGYNQWLGFEAKWTVKALVDFEVQMLLGFGCAFELPLVLLVLNILGLVSSSQLAGKRRHAVVIIFIAVCCIIPSTDLFSLSILFVPMYLLFESCIWISRIMENRRAVAEKSG